jgi:hypothetical protein
MLKRYKNLIILGLIFLTLSAVLYYVHYLIFEDAHHIFIYLVGDLAFMPLEVFLVIIVIERLLAQREKREMLQKLNMVIGAFYSEVGTYLLGYLLPVFENHEEIRAKLDLRQDWTSSEFKKAMNFARILPNQIIAGRICFADLKIFLVGKRSFLLSLLENPNLLEDESFTDVLWAVFHLDEELEARSSLSELPETDIQHLAGDVRRLYCFLVTEWLEHVKHLKARYPYLYSLVLRTHPFQSHPSAIVKGT